MSTRGDHERIGPIVFIGLLLALGCSGYPSTDHPSPTVTQGEEREAIGTMRIWLREFRSAQSRHYDERGHYADEVTVDGRIQPLPPPYRTSYEAPPRLNRYLVEVRHTTSRRLCKLEVGEGAFEPGEIVCNVY